MLLIFDIDGTLCDTKDIGDNCFIELFEQKYQCNLGNIEWERFPNVTDKGLFCDVYQMQFGIVPTIEIIEDFKKVYCQEITKLADNQADKFKVVKGANEFLAACKEKNLPIAIATGAWRDVALLKMQTAGLHFENIVLASSDDDFRRTGIVETAIENVKIQHQKTGFEKIVYFGDGLWDLKCCQDLDIHFIGVDIDGNQKLHKAGTPFIVEHFEKLEDIFLYINNL